MGAILIPQDFVLLCACICLLYVVVTPAKHVSMKLLMTMKYLLVLQSSQVQILF